MLNLPTARRRRRGGPARPPSRFVHLHLEELEPRAVPAVGISAFPGPQPSDLSNVFTFNVSPVGTTGQLSFATQQTLGSALLTYGTQNVPGFASLYPVANSFFSLNGLVGAYGFEVQLLAGAVPALAPYGFYSTQSTGMPLELNTVFVPTPGPQGLPLSTPAPLPILDPAQYQLMRFLNPFRNNTDTISLVNQIYLNNGRSNVGGAGDNRLPEPAAPANNEMAPTEDNLLQYIRVLGDARPVHPGANQAQPPIERTTPAPAEKGTLRVEPARPVAAEPEASAAPVEQQKTSDTIAFWTVKTPDEVFWDTSFDAGDLPAPVINSWAPVVDALAIVSGSSDGGDGGDAGDPDA